MPRYIDADVLFYKMLKTKDGLQEAAARTDDHQEAWMAEGMEAFLSDLNHFPTADVAPVVHGKWEPRQQHKGGHSYVNYFCSVCGRRMIGYSDPADCPYCHCGAKMDLEEEE